MLNLFFLRSLSSDLVLQLLENGGIGIAKITGLQLLRTSASDSRLLQTGPDESGEGRCADRVVVPRLIEPYESVRDQVKADTNLRICGGYTLACPQCRYRNCSVARPSTRSGRCCAINFKSAIILLLKGRRDLTFGQITLRPASVGWPP